MNEQTNLKEQYGRPSEFAMTIAMEGIKNEIIKFKEQIENDEIVGEKKKYLQALFDLNNKLVNEYGKKGGDATGYWLEFEKDEKDPYKIWNWIY
jgi:hypothetical protein|tara:strand:+ start:213 stop:494 length:282 start_codon:yes stop_codon:yes gene_type:complete